MAAALVHVRAALEAHEAACGGPLAADADGVTRALGDLLAVADVFEAALAAAEVAVVHGQEGGTKTTVANTVASAAVARDAVFARAFAAARAAGLGGGIGGGSTLPAGFVVETRAARPRRRRRRRPAGVLVL